MFEDLIKVLTKSKRLLILCVGNSLRKDDGVGIYIGRNLIKKGICNVIICEHGIEFYTDKILRFKPQTILIIDAIHDVSNILKPGDVVFGRIDDVYTLQTILSSHTLPINVILEYLKLRGLKVKDTYILGIQVKDTEFSENLSLSSEVRESADLIIELIVNILTKKEYKF